MSLRRRRDGARGSGSPGGAILWLCTGSERTEGTLILSTAPPFAGWRRRWISVGSVLLREHPDLAVGSSWRRGCPGCHEEGEISLRKTSESAAFSRALRSATCFPTRVGTARESCRERGAACRGRWRGNAPRWPARPAPLGAGEGLRESAARVQGSNARRVCPRVVKGCRSRQATSRLRDACSRWQRGA